jgi:hypothetical protein
MGVIPFLSFHFLVIINVRIYSDSKPIALTKYQSIYKLQTSFDERLQKTIAQQQGLGS